MDTPLSEPSDGGPDVAPGERTREHAQWLRTHEPLAEAAYAALVDPPRVQTQALLLVGTLALFILAQLVTGGSWVSTGVLVAVLFVHELGHYLGMRWFGYRDVRMFFIPMIGAAVSGTPMTTVGWKDAIVTLLGPVPGILLGLLLAVGVVAGLGPPGLSSAAVMLVALNAFNLLPIVPLDGGRLFQTVFFNRHPKLSLAFTALGALSLTALAIWAGAWFLFLMSFFLIGAVRVQIKQPGAIAWLRQTQPQLPLEPAELSPDQRYALFTAARLAVPESMESNPAALAAVMRQLLAAGQPRMPIVAAAGLIATWALSLVAALIAGGLLAEPPATPATAWARHECEGLNISVELPTAPTPFSEPDFETPLGRFPARGCVSVAQDGAIFNVMMAVTGSTIDEGDRRAWVAAAAERLGPGTAVTTDGLDAQDFSSTIEVHERFRYVFAGSMIIQLAAVGGTPEDGLRFVESFRRSRPR